jgi:hypothetical protein
MMAPPWATVTAPSIDINIDYGGDGDDRDDKEDKEEDKEDDGDKSDVEMGG